MPELIRAPETPPNTFRFRRDQWRRCCGTEGLVSIQAAVNGGRLPHLEARVCVQSLQSCPTLGNAKDCNPPSSSVCGILQTRTLEWVAIPSSRGSSDLGIKPMSPVSLALTGGFFTTKPLGSKACR